MRTTILSTFAFVIALCHPLGHAAKATLSGEEGTRLTRAVAPQNPAATAAMDQEFASAVARRDLFEERGIKGLANRLGATILKMNETNLIAALEPIKWSPDLLEKLTHSSDLTNLVRATRAADGVDCVGFNMISTEVITFVYVFTTEMGPYGIKFSVYLYKQTFHVSGLAVTSNWDGLEKMVQTVTPLETKLRITRKMGLQ